MNWKWIKGYEGKFKIYENSVVERLYFESIDKAGRCWKYEPRIEKTRKDKNGYNKVCYHKNDEYVHRLVAMHFIPNPENKEYVNHIDGNKQNNLLSNLEWSTPTENMQHASKHNLINRHSEKRKKQAPINTRNAGKYNKTRLGYFDEDKKLIEIFKDIYDALEHTNYTYKVIISNAMGQTKRTKNKTYFKFMDPL